MSKKPVQPSDKKSSRRDLTEKQLLEPAQRAEDVLLGSLGFSEDARIIEIAATTSGYKGRGTYSDNEEFVFESEDPLSALEQWALEQLLQSKKA